MLAVSPALYRKAQHDTQGFGLQNRSVFLLIIQLLLVTFACAIMKRFS
jgi:uncharacterized membrane protein